VLVALLGAAVAAIAYGTATVLQAIGVQRMAAVPDGAALWTRLVAGRLYAFGLILDVLGFLASVASLRTLPLFLVESAVASSVAVTAVLAVLVLDLRLRRAEITALAVIGVGLVLLAVSAEPGPAHHAGAVAGWVLLGTVALVALMLLIGLRDANSVRASLILATAAGAGYGLVGIAARALEVRHPWWQTAADPVVWALLAQGALAVIAYGFALHRGRVTTVAAITMVVETVFPAIVGLAFLGDAVRDHLTPLAVIGFVATLAGSLALANQAEVDAAEARS
jgi:drug/metabolite transporter (DMT)-like permease